MAIDRAAYIGEMDLNLPANTDARAEGAGQIRAVKTATQNSFPEVNGPINYTDVQINTALSAVLGSDDSTTPVGAIPVGAILMWSGLIVNIPAGWALCNGETSNEIVTPDLRGKFVVGYDPNEDDYIQVGNTGGSLTHDHVGETEGHALTEEELPTHKHLDGTFARDQYEYNDTHYPNGWEENLPTTGGYNAAEHHNGRATRKIYTSEAGEDKEHKHGIVEDGHRPPYYVIAYIMYVGI